MQTCPVPTGIREAAIRQAALHNFSRVFFWQIDQAWVWSCDGVAASKYREPAWIEVVQEGE